MKKIINSPLAPKAVGPYSQAVLSGNTLYVSGQIPIDASIGKVVEGGIVEQTHQVLKNIGHILDEAGLTYSNVLKCTVLLDNMDNFVAMNEVYAQYFPENPPARAAFGVVRLPLGVMVEIECIAEV
jgi:2-iminobutanoate/2-iminopropanoate deaminase